MSLLKIFDIANSAMIAQSQKMQIHASNLANIDSLVNTNGKLHPYIAKKIILKFDNSNDSGSGGVKVEKIIDDTTPLKVIYDPNNPIANSQGFSEISNVNVVTETINAIAASRNYQANLEVLNTVKSMIMKTLTIGQ
ncbi:MAG: flagellar basal body rod protein FlgC [Buchnera aphidicola (Kaburagia rhusicola rhusicola)]